MPKWLKPIDSPFRLIPINPATIHSWNINLRHLFYDSFLTFGASALCTIFEAFSSFFEQIAKYK